MFAGPSVLSWLTFDDLLRLRTQWGQGGTAVVIIVTRYSEVLHSLQRLTEGKERLVVFK